MSTRRLCECGCGAEVRKRFLPGHWLRVPGAAQMLAKTRIGISGEQVRGTAERNAEIRSRFDAGESMVDLAVEYGVTRQRIEQICRKERARARAAVQSALQRGAITRPGNCERCGTGSTAIESHHPRYSEPLNVEWLCRPCHVQADRERRRLRNERRRAPDGPALRLVRERASRRRKQRAEERRRRVRHREAERDRMREEMVLRYAELALRLGHTPRQAEMNTYLPYCHVTYFKYFGSPNRLAREIGLTPVPRGHGRWRPPPPVPPNFAQVVERLRQHAHAA